MMPGKSTPFPLKPLQARVLVCDDSPVNTRIVKALLDKEKIRSEVVSSGEEALERVDRESYDLILMDMELPGINGLDVVRHLRKTQSDTVYQPIILLTANQDNQSRIDGLKAGATDFLTKPFDPVELVTRIRNQVAAKRLYDEVLTINKELQEERQKVFRIQSSLLPACMPVVAGWQLAASYIPSSLASGDFYDAIRLPNDNLLVAVADVSGHGLPAAMYMSTIRALFHTEASNATPPAEMLQRINRVLVHGMDQFSFVTFYLAEIEPLTGIVHQYSAGHHPPIVHDRRNNRIITPSLQPTFPLGIESDLPVKRSTFQLEPGQRLIAYTDGLVEQTDGSGNYFEKSGVIQSLAAAVDYDTEEAVKRITQDIRTFMPTTLPTDDITFIVIDYLG